MSVLALALPHGRHDHAARRKAQRRGREKGCWVYITQAELLGAEQPPDGSAPWYRVWGGQRGRCVVTLYSKP